MLSKSHFTQQIIERLGIKPQFTLEDAMHWYWHNPRDGGSWRLTNLGYDALVGLGVDQHSFSVPNQMPVIPRHLLVLDRKLTQPYFIRIGKNPGLVLFGSQEATMYALYGDFQKFISYLSRT